MKKIVKVYFTLYDLAAVNCVWFLHIVSCNFASTVYPNCRLLHGKLVAEVQA